jgi:hypothetical protein
MNTIIKRFTATLAVAALGLTAVPMVNPVQSGPLATPTAAACSTSQFRIIWGTVGVRNYPGSSYYTAYLSYGNYAYGPSGGTSGGWTYISYWRSAGDYVGGYIPQSSREYTGCF